ncbi:hypothetical protein HZU75_08725 [Chitinibacter fontanus]|uniref:Uncharacterized protein n=1 Tax=Chitinibacter fontanus TaxID=1737446 RepID=A0A7D5ZFL7_9NEIS|nr:hypothetical protein [Chitinibacter fontanus]QLI81608.1 hypothetical protein HZU75_08725 [Chitinibacter fontanus]
MPSKSTLPASAPANTNETATTKPAAAKRTSSTQAAANRKPATNTAAAAPSKAPARSRRTTSSTAKPAASPQAPTVAAKAASVVKTAPAPAQETAINSSEKPVKKAEKVEKVEKTSKKSSKKTKLIRDSFTFPAADYALIAATKQRVVAAGVEVKKSELIRAGLTALAAMNDAQLLALLGGLEKIKTGRPSK